MSERRYPLQKWPGPGPKPRVWDDDSAYAHSWRQRYIERFQARRAAARAEAKEAARTARKRRFRELVKEEGQNIRKEADERRKVAVTREERRREEMQELQRKIMPMGLFGLGLVEAMAGLGVGQPKAARRLIELIVEEDAESARYPNLPGILAEQDAADEDICLRFGEAPEDGKSLMVPGSRTFGHKKERGVSTCGGKLTVDGNFLITCRGAALRYYLKAMLDEDRQAFFVRGRCVERKNDGECVLRETTFEPVPDTALIAIEGSPSRALERWLARRGVDLSGLVKSA